MKIHYYVSKEIIEKVVGIGIDIETPNSLFLPQDTVEEIKKILDIEDSYLVICYNENGKGTIGYSWFGEWRPQLEFPLSEEELIKVCLTEEGCVRCRTCTEEITRWACGCEEVSHILHYDHPYPQTSPCPICGAGWVSWWGDPNPTFISCENHIESLID
jgi:hypothetical protein